MKKVVLITGASSKIGEAISRELIKDYEVILHYNTNENRITTLKEELEKKTKEELISIVIQMQVDIQEERDEIYRRRLLDTF